jgi:hypothetical protein
LTRIVEYDSQGNAAAILARFPISVLYSTLPAYFISPRAGDLPPFQCEAGGTAAHSRQSPPVASVVIGGDDAVGIEISANIADRVRAVPPPLRLLTTTWLYDAETKTLFPSDVFTHELLGHAEDDIACASHVTAAAEDPERIARILSSKFDWLPRADVEPIRQGLRDVFASHDIVNIAPGSGRIILGRDAVTRAFESVDEALALMSKLHGHEGTCS